MTHALTFNILHKVYFFKVVMMVAVLRLTWLSLFQFTIYSLQFISNGNFDTCSLAEITHLFNSCSEREIVLGDIQEW